MVRLAQLVRASDCGSEGRGFDPHTSPLEGDAKKHLLFYFHHPSHIPAECVQICDFFEFVGTL